MSGEWRRAGLAAFPECAAFRNVAERTRHTFTMEKAGVVKIVLFYREKHQLD